jgi:hypothetical protein
MNRYAQKVVVMSVLFAIGGCATGSAHDNFSNWMEDHIGRSIDDPNVLLNRYPEERGSTHKLANGNVEHEFIWSRRPNKSCLAFFEVDTASQRIIAWRYEGTKDTCYLVP